MALPIRYFRMLSFFSIPKYDFYPDMEFASPLEALQEFKPIICPPEKEVSLGCANCGVIDSRLVMFLGEDGKLRCTACSKGPHELVRVGDSVVREIEFSEAALN